MRFTFIYLMFCIVYHLFWHFYVCFYLVGDVQVEGSKNEQSVAKKRQKRKFWAKQESMPQHDLVMPQHEVTQSKNLTPTCHSMPKRCKDRILKPYRSMPKPCRGMATFSNLGYFWQLGLDSYVILLFLLV